jgi:hypothetical protein
LFRASKLNNKSPRSKNLKEKRDKVKRKKNWIFTHINGLSLYLIKIYLNGSSSLKRTFKKYNFNNLGINKSEKYL